MTDELDKLRPEVREAVACMDSCATIKPACGDGFMNETWLTIRAELLRLASIEADALIALDCEHDWQVEHKRAEKAEAKLAALRAKIEAAPLTTFRRAMLGTPHACVEGKFACPEWIGKRVRLVVEE